MPVWLFFFQKPLGMVVVVMVAVAAVMEQYAVYRLKLLQTKSLQNHMHASFHRAKRSRARIKFWLKTWKT